MSYKELFVKKIGFNECLDILIEADNHFRLKGLVYPFNENKERFFVIVDNEFAGFVSPRFESYKWRLGAVYCKEKYRNTDYRFMERLINYVLDTIGKQNVFFELVDKDNYQMKRLLEKTGFYFIANTHTNIEIWERQPYESRS